MFSIRFISRFVLLFRWFLCKSSYLFRIIAQILFFSQRRPIQHKSGIRIASSRIQCFHERYIYAYPCYIITLNFRNPSRTCIFNQLRRCYRHPAILGIKPSLHSLIYSPLCIIINVVHIMIGFNRNFFAHRTCRRLS